MPAHTFDIGFISFSLQIFMSAMNFLLKPNGWRYPLVGGTRQRHFAGINLKPATCSKNAATPTSRVHAVLGSHLLTALPAKLIWQCNFMTEAEIGV
jgi:hypothetical protein